MQCRPGGAGHELQNDFAIWRESSSAVFDEIAEALCETIARAGGAARITGDPLDQRKGELLLAVGTHKLPAGRIPGRHVALMTEQPTSMHCDDACLQHAFNADLALDWSPRNARYWRSKGVRAVDILPFGAPARLLSWRPPWWEPLGFMWGRPRTDAVFAGSMNDWRDSVISSARSKGLTVRVRLPLPEVHVSRTWFSTVLRGSQYRPAPRRWWDRRGARSETWPCREQKLF